MKRIGKIFLPFLLALILLFAVIFYLNSEKNADISFSRPTPAYTPVTNPISTPIPVVSSFSFVVISDIHNDLISLEKALVRIKSDHMDFIIVAGDLTSLGKLTELKNVKDDLDKSGIEYYVIPGNHDLWSVRGENNPFAQVFGKDYQSFSKGKIKFILMNNGDGTIGVDKTQEAWLDKEISDCPKVFCLVFAHMPLNHPLSSHIMGEENPEVASQASRLVRKFNDYKVKALFSGHIHFLGEYTLDGLNTYTDGAIFTNGSTSIPRFLEVTVTLPEIKLDKKEIWLTDKQ